MFDIEELAKLISGKNPEYIFFDKNREEFISYETKKDLPSPLSDDSLKEDWMNNLKKFLSSQYKKGICYIKISDNISREHYSVFSRTIRNTKRNTKAKVRIGKSAKSS